MNRFLFLPLALLLLLALPASADLPAGVTLQPDIAYGADPAQRLMSICRRTRRTRRSCSWCMAAAGVWAIRTNERVVDNKVAHWVPQGVIFVSVNYRMIPEAEPLVQAEDVARALAKVQELAPGWGGNSRNVILMGHSAGAHLVALVSAAPEIAAAQGAKPWKGAVLLDSGAMDVPAVMNARHMPLYDKAFGDDPGRLAGGLALSSPYRADAADPRGVPPAQHRFLPRQSRLRRQGREAGRQGRRPADGSQPWRDQQAARAARRLYETRG